MGFKYTKINQLSKGKAKNCFLQVLLKNEFKIKECVLGATEFLETKDFNVNCFAKARILLAAVTSL